MSCQRICKINCIAFQTPSCPLTEDSSRALIIAHGLKELPGTRHNLWRAFMAKEEIIRGKDGLAYLDDFIDRIES